MEENKNNQQSNQSNDYQYWHQRQIIMNRYRESEASEVGLSTPVKFLIGGGIAIIVLSITTFFFFSVLFKNVIIKEKNKEQAFKNAITKNSPPIELQLQYIHSTEKVFSKIEASIVNYQINNKIIDLSDLDNPSGTLNNGFIFGSPLYEKLNIDYNQLSFSSNYDLRCFYIVFDTNGKDGRYKIYCDSSRNNNKRLTYPSYNYGILIYDPEDKSTTQQYSGNSEIPPFRNFNR